MKYLFLPGNKKFKDIGTDIARIINERRLIYELERLHNLNSRSARS